MSVNNTAASDAVANNTNKKVKSKKVVLHLLAA